MLHQLMYYARLASPQLGRIAVMTRLRTAALAASTSAWTLLLAPAAHAGTGDPAGGAPLGDVMLATGGAMILTALVLAVGSAHRSGRIEFLARAGAWAEQKTGLPGRSPIPPTS